jgi:NAD dependent epimerase/dehydratase family enzyme
VNLVSPNPVTNREFAKTLGRVLRRPAVLPTPVLPLRLAFGGEFVEEVLLASTRAVPSRLTATGYGFEHRDLETALTDVLAR